MLFNLSKANRDFETSSCIQSGVEYEWLWGSDPQEPCSHEIMLNRNQLLGILVCRSKRKSTAASTERFILTDKPIDTLTFGELRDTIANIQLEWPVLLENIQQIEDPSQTLLNVKGVIEACAARFGAFCGHVWEEDMTGSPMDFEPAPMGEAGYVLRCSSMRRMVGSLLILYRHLFLLSIAEDPGPPSHPIEIRGHHHEASNENFSEWHMHFQLPVGAKLNYRHDFPGMYNHVSQPVYFHNPTFEKCLREPISSPKATSIHVMPSLFELYPDVCVKFEDDRIDPVRDKTWYWLLVSGRVYMVGGGKVFFSTDARRLLGAYLRFSSPADHT